MSCCYCTGCITAAETHLHKKAHLYTLHKIINLQLLPVCLFWSVSNPHSEDEVSTIFTSHFLDSTSSYYMHSLRFVAYSLLNCLLCVVASKSDQIQQIYMCINPWKFCKNHAKDLTVTGTISAKFLISGSIACSASRRYLIYSEAKFWGFSRATRCIDGGEIWHGSSMPNFTPSVQR